MTTANVTPTTPGAIPFTLADFEASLTRLVRRVPYLAELINVGRTNSKHVVWVEQANADPGAAANTAEGALKTQGDFDLVERTCPVEKITYFVKVSKEMLEDVSFIQAEIENEIMELLRLRLDQQILEGSAVTPQLKGILNSGIPVFVAPAQFALLIPNANNFDVIRVAISIIESSTPDGPFMPNIVIMHPQDVAALDLAKDSTGAYVLPPFIMPGGRLISGVRVIANIGVPLDTYVVGDFTKSNLRMREDATITMGYENDDFTKNLVTILGEIRAVHYIKNNHLKAFVRGVFSTNRAALLAP
jgi:HK97 family phage major capsid protein